MTGQCECNAGYKFADCSKKVIEMEGNDGKSMDISMKGPGWFTVQYSGSKHTSLSISPNVTSDVYISRSAAADPNDFVYDFKLSNISSNITLNAAELGLKTDAGYSVAIYCNAINETANEILQGSINLFISESASVLSLATSIITFTASLLA